MESDTTKEYNDTTIASGLGIVIVGIVEYIIKIFVVKSHTTKSNHWKGTLQEFRKSGILIEESL